MENNEIFNKIKDSSEDMLSQIENDNIRELTKDERKKLYEGFRNLTVGTAYVGDEYLYIDKESFKSWSYYAGFEYIDSDEIEYFGDLMIFNRHSTERVEEAFEMIEEQEEECPECNNTENECECEN